MVFSFSLTELQPEGRPRSQSLAAEQCLPVAWRWDASHLPPSRATIPRNFAQTPCLKRPPAAPRTNTLDLRHQAKKLSQTP
jgi:hypothetical protein